MTRHLVDRERLPGIRAEKLAPAPMEISRHGIWLDDAYLGCVVYVSRDLFDRRGRDPVRTSTEFGWRPHGSHLPLTTRVEAIEALPAVQSALTTRARKARR